MKGIRFYFGIRLVSNDSSFLSVQRLRQAYLCLDLDEAAEINEVRQRYAQLVRKFHPDTGGENADPARLQKIRDACKLILKTAANEDVNEEREEEERDFGIRHIVPQHRQYLEYGGAGFGSPSNRQRQWQQYRVTNALENVREFTVEKAVRESQDPKNAGLIAVHQQKKRQKNRLTGMLDRVVEDMILSSMGAGEFNNLKGAGKPLKMDQSNPYIDQTQQTINRILRDNGFAPPWIVKENELRQRVDGFKKRLRQELAFEIILLLNSDAFNEFNFLDAFDNARILNLIEGKQFVDREISDINRLIKDYNLIAPSMDRQFMSLRKDLQLERAKNEVLKEFPNSQFMIDAQKRFQLESNKDRKKKASESKGFFESLLAKYH